jgi:ABC-type nitrate/sulfonate/bicarbonate transport system permease component
LRAVLEQIGTLLRSGAVLHPLRITVLEVASAFCIAAALGIFAGYGISRTAYRITVFDPLLTSIYAIPAILFFPLYTLFFGIGPGSKIALGATISFFPIALSTIAAFGSIETTFVVAARAMGARGWQLFRRVLLPAAFPTVFSGLRIGLTLCFLSVLGGETIASFAGLGHEIANAAADMDPATMYAYIVIVIAIAALLNFLLARAESFGVRR